MLVAIKQVIYIIRAPASMYMAQESVVSGEHAKEVQNERASTLTPCGAESPSPIESQPTHERVERALT